MRYLLSGYYGRQNTGDDALLYVTLSGLSRLDPEARFSVISAEPLATPPGTRLDVFHPESARFLSVRRLLRSDLWVFGGGGVIQDNTPRSVEAMRHLVRLAAIARLARRKIVLLAVGLGPLETPEGRSLAARLLALADFVTVRDSESAALAAAIGVTRPATVTADLVLGLRQELPVERLTSPDARKTLGISLLDLAYVFGPSGSSASLLPVISDALGRILRDCPEWQVRLFAFHGSPHCGDAAVLQELAARLGDPSRVELLPYQPDCLAVFRDIAQCDAFLGMRLHSCVLAYMAEVPTLVLDYHPKCRAFAHLIEAPTGAILTLPELESPEAVSARLELLIHCGPRLLPGLPPAAAAARSDANFTLLESWLRTTLRP